MDPTSAACVEPIPWHQVERALRRLSRGPSPHKLSPFAHASPRRAAVAVVLWGDACGAREVVLIQRGALAPRHASEIAFPGGMAETWDRDLRCTARRELAEELGVSEGLWEMGCLPDGVAKGRTRFTPVLFRWELPEPRFILSHEVQRVLRLGLSWLMAVPWTEETLQFHGLACKVPRLELEVAPLWGATALVLKAWLDALREASRDVPS